MWLQNMSVYLPDLLGMYSVSTVHNPIPSGGTDAWNMAMCARSSKALGTVHTLHNIADVCEDVCDVFLHYWWY